MVEIEMLSHKELSLEFNSYLLMVILNFIMGEQSYSRVSNKIFSGVSENEILNYLENKFYVGQSVEMEDVEGVVKQLYSFPMIQKNREGKYYSNYLPLN